MYKEKCFPHEDSGALAQVAQKVSRPWGLSGHAKSVPVGAPLAASAWARDLHRAWPACVTQAPSMNNIVLN